MGVVLNFSPSCSVLVTHGSEFVDGIHLGICKRGESQRGLRHHKMLTYQVLRRTGPSLRTSVTNARNNGVVKGIR